jgi:hypothetical protein
MSGALIAAFVLTAAGTIEADRQTKKAARERQRRQNTLFANQKKFSEKAQRTLQDNLKTFSAQSEASRRDAATVDALKGIEGVADKNKVSREGSKDLGVLGNISEAKITRDASAKSASAAKNANKNTALSDFLGIAGGRQQTGFALNDLGRSLNDVRVNSKGQLTVDESRVAHSPQPNMTFANILKAAGFAAGVAGAGTATAGGSTSSLSAADAGATFGSEGISQAGGNFLGQTGGAATQGFAGAGSANFVPAFFKAPVTQFGFKGVQSAPAFKFGNLIPR